MSTPSIAATKVVACEAGGEAFEITIEVGTPFPADGYWACPVALFGLYEEPLEGRGSDALQALCLGTWLLGELLRSFEEDGGSLRFPEGSDFPLKAYKFGLDPVRPNPGEPGQAEP